MVFTEVVYEWSNLTFLLYLAIIASCFLLPVLMRKSVRVLGGRKQRCIPLWVFGVGAILIFFKGFGTAGRDLRGGYYLNFMSATSMRAYRDHTIELGYRLLTVFMRKFTDDYAVFLMVVALITLIPVLYLFCKHSGEIDAMTAALFYVSIFYFSGFSPSRQYIAASIALLSYDALLEKKPVKALAFLCAASLFHITALVLVIPYFFSLQNVLKRRQAALAIGAIFFLVYLSKNVIVAAMAATERYYIYGLSEGGLGMEQFVYFLPLFVIYFFGRRCEGRRLEDGYARVGLLYLTTAFAIGLMGYFFDIFGRMYGVFLPLAFITAHYVKVIKQHSNRTTQLILNICVVFYCVARFVIYITQYYNLEDIMPYTNVFGWAF